MTFRDIARLFDRPTALQALTIAWGGWCQDEKCPDYPHGPRPSFNEYYFATAQKAQGRQP
jgi:hypothetical protein